MKLIVAGSRNNISKEYVFDVLDSYRRISNIPRTKIITPKITELVSGLARGVDRYGMEWAEQYNIPIKEFPADWTTYSKWAGLKRNTEMAEYADGLIAFWDGGSRGTKHMIETAIKRHLKYVMVYQPEEVKTPAPTNLWDRYQKSTKGRFV